MTHKNPLGISEDQQHLGSGGDPDFTGEMWKSLLALFSHEVASQDSSLLTTDGFSNPSVYVQCICGCVCLLPHKILIGTRDKTRGRL